MTKLACPACGDTNLNFIPQTRVPEADHNSHARHYICHNGVNGHLIRQPLYGIGLTNSLPNTQYHTFKYTSFTGALEVWSWKQNDFVIISN